MFSGDLLFNQRWIQMCIFVLSGLILFAHVAYGQIQADGKPAILQASLHIERLRTIPNDETGKIQPGTPVKIDVTVENNGEEVSPEGEMYVRYAFANPLDQEPMSVIFKTEKMPLPSIEPGKKINIIFSTSHQIPSVADFIRCDWSMREYQAIASIQKQEHLIGTLALTFSAYYYSGIKKEFPQEIR